MALGEPSTPEPIEPVTLEHLSSPPGTGPGYEPIPGPPTLVADWPRYQPPSLYPTLLPSPTPTLVEAATARVNAQGGSLTEDEVIAVLRAAGAPEAWIPDMVAISQCESRHSPYAVGDGGNSLGMFQLWFGWARAYGVSVEALFDPLVNAKVALYVREVRGRFGGGGGWSCATHMGIP